MRGLFQHQVNQSRPLSQAKGAKESQICDSLALVVHVFQRLVTNLPDWIVWRQFDFPSMTIILFAAKNETFAIQIPGTKRLVPARVRLGASITVGI
jgi:hypothetical protein